MSELREIRSALACGLARGCEDNLQQSMAAAFTRAGLAFEREVALSAADRIDFVLGEIGIEVKVDGSAPALIRQLQRYAQHGRLRALLVVTTRARLMQLPAELSGKPVHVLSLLEAGL